MATLISAQIRWMADQYVNHCGYKSAVLSGIVPDQRHLDNGGYHCSVEDLRRFGNSGDYSNSRADDRNYNIRFGAAVDVSMNPADMRRHHDRVRAVFDDRADPRRRYINAINTWDGSGDAIRLDFAANTSKRATPDHKWHAHDETRRRYLLDDLAVRAKVSVWKGESKAAWLASQKPAPVEEFVMATEAQVRAIVRDEVTKAAGPAAIITAVVAALEQIRPFQASGPRKRLQDDRPADQKWNNLSLRMLLEYCFENSTGSASAAVMAEFQEEIRAAIGRIVVDPGNSVQLDPHTVEVLAELLAPRIPTAVQIAAAVNDDTHRRMQS